MNTTILPTATVLGAVSTLPPILVSVLKSFGPRAVVAGGLLRAITAGENVADVDVWVSSREDAAGVVAYIERIHNATFDSPLEVIPLETHVTENSTTIRGLGICVQVIHRWTYDTPDKLIESFDYTLARAAIWWNSTAEMWLSTCDENFLRDVDARRLVYCAPIRDEARAGSLFRLFKFYKKGYSVSLETLAAVIARAVHGCSGDDVAEATHILAHLQAAGRRLPSPPKPPDLGIEDVGELTVAGLSSSIGAGS